MVVFAKNENVGVEKDPQSLSKFSVVFELGFVLDQFLEFRYRDHVLVVSF